MKKTLFCLISLLLTLCLLAGCTGTTVVVGNCTCPTEAPSSAPVTVIGNGLKVGMAVLTKATPEEVLAGTSLSFDVTVAAVTVDEAGVIQSCVIESLNPSVTVDGNGQILSDTAAQILTKTELGEAYGMKASGSKYEWYEQAAFVAESAIGKTAEDLKNGTFGEHVEATGLDLASSASIYFGGYVNAIVLAATNAQDLGASVGDTLKFAVIPTLSSSSSASAESTGTIQLDCDVAAMTMDGEAITSCYIDSLQAKITIGTDGTLNIPESFPTKNELKEGYNMKAWGQATYEWYEQAASFAAYVTGKTIDEVNGISVNEKTVPTEADLASSVTIAIGGFKNLLTKAVQ